MMWGTFARVVVSLAVLGGRGAAANRGAIEPPSITADGTQLNLRASDVVFTGSDNQAPVSLVAMASKLEAMQALLEKELAVIKQNMTNMAATVSALPTADAMDEALRAMAAGVTNELLAVQKKGTDTVNARVDTLVADIAGLPELGKTVGVLALDVDYLLAHADNITRCGETHGLHLGDGECVSAVPQCTKPDAPTGGTVVLSSEYLIPGATATYACDKDSDFVAGPTVRTCREKTKQFDGPLPKCLTCLVANCVTCKGTASTCSKCAYGHDPSDDKKTCKERATSVILLGKGHYDAQHEILKPNADQYVSLNPSMHPTTPTGGAAALIQGTIYLLTRGCLPYMLKKGASSWASYAKPPFTALDQPFYATLSGVGSKEDGFYVFSNQASAVYKPSTNTWARITLLGNGEPRSVRNKGGTAVVGARIYCVGGYAGATAGKHSAEVHYYDATQGAWNKAPSMTTGRHDVAASAYGSKVFAFGGITGGNIRLATAEMLDTSAGGSGKWVGIMAMPEAWSMMGNGPMPAFAGGTILIPGANRAGKISGSIEYDIAKDKWTLKTPSPRIRKTAIPYLIVFGAYE